MYQLEYSSVEPKVLAQSIDRYLITIGLQTAILDAQLKDADAAEKLLRAIPELMRMAYTQGLSEGENRSLPGELDDDYDVD